MLTPRERHNKKRTLFKTRRTRMICRSPKEMPLFELQNGSCRLVKKHRIYKTSDPFYTLKKCALQLVYKEYTVKSSVMFGRGPTNTYYYIFAYESSFSVGLFLCRIAFLKTESVKWAVQNVVLYMAVFRLANNVLHYRRAVKRILHMLRKLR